MTKTPELLQALKETEGHTEAHNKGMFWYCGMTLIGGQPDTNKRSIYGGEKFDRLICVLNSSFEPWTKEDAANANLLKYAPFFRSEAERLQAQNSQLFEIINAKSIEESSNKFMSDLIEENIQLKQQNAALREALEKMIYYAAIIIEPKTTGTIYPDKAEEELDNARDLIRINL